MNAHTIDTILDLYAALESQLGSLGLFCPLGQGVFCLSFSLSSHLGI